MCAQCTARSPSRCPRQTPWRLRCGMCSGADMWACGSSGSLSAVSRIHSLRRRKDTLFSARRWALGRGTRGASSGGASPPKAMRSTWEARGWWWATRARPASSQVCGRHTGCGATLTAWAPTRMTGASGAPSGRRTGRNHRPRRLWTATPPQWPPGQSLTRRASHLPAVCCGRADRRWTAASLSAQVPSSRQRLRQRRRRPPPRPS